MESEKERSTTSRFGGPLLFVLGMMVVAVARAETNSSDGLWFSPNRQTSVRQTSVRGRIDFIDERTRSTIYSYEPQARLIDPFWSRKSSWLLIDEQYNRYRGHLSAFYLAERKVTRIDLPDEVLTNPVELIPANRRPAINHDTGSGIDRKKWLRHGRLIIEATGGGVIHHSDGSEYDFSVTMEFTVQCHPDGTSHLLHRRTLRMKWKPN